MKLRLMETRSEVDPVFGRQLGIDIDNSNVSVGSCNELPGYSQAYTTGSSF